MAFKIKQITDPKFPIEFPDGSTVEYDPFAVHEMIENYVRANPDGGEFVVYDAIRVGFSLPTASDVAAGKAVYFDGADPEGKPGTFTRNQSLEIRVELERFIAELPVSKKALALGQSLSASSASASPSSNR